MERLLIFDHVLLEGLVNLLEPQLVLESDKGQGFVPLIIRILVVLLLKIAREVISEDKLLKCMLESVLTQDIGQIIATHPPVLQYQGLVVSPMLHFFVVLHLDHVSLNSQVNLQSTAVVKDHLLKAKDLKAFGHIVGFLA